MRLWCDFGRRWVYFRQPHIWCKSLKWSTVNEPHQQRYRHAEGSSLIIISLYVGKRRWVRQSVFLSASIELDWVKVDLKGRAHVKYYEYPNVSRGDVLLEQKLFCAWFMNANKKVGKVQLKYDQWLGWWYAECAMKFKWARSGERTM